MDFIDAVCFCRPLLLMPAALGRFAGGYDHQVRQGGEGAAAAKGESTLRNAMRGL